MDALAEVKWCQKVSERTSHAMTSCKIPWFRLKICILAFGKLQWPLAHLQWLRVWSTAIAVILTNRLTAWDNQGGCHDVLKIELGLHQYSTYADEEKNKLVAEFAIPGAPTETSIWSSCQTASIWHASKGHRVCFSTSLAWPVKPDKPSDLRARLAPNRGAIQRPDGRCDKGRNQPGGAEREPRKSKPGDPLTWESLFSSCTDDARFIKPDNTGWRCSRVGGRSVTTDL